ncbi:hypothetical protein AGABI1DRAFT_92673 [Agaricus bisporus var. burnettii JB137-S8]|uniref:DUF7587 domain-containing protein n=1 Tax=Agaricus bisporus var. burnettii (strain JB137-S8 / ATCC MYA-4627 / FGSC 10392) TaxID=597362 RepID=K5XTI1_AGABU|nr:uncharacterized protein AGABI1DRAFT_92673 [Agaricus bisporus var. burnettii JB137-S8]EKM78350.1 hypothetical protein AGABI1DRAFT_92673 [Agaricus bisporus var. burnettii JB137-S8]
MTTYPPLPTNESRSLPQYGFGPDNNFQSLLLENPFLFRIYTPKERSPFFDDTDPYFLAPKFNAQCVRSPVELEDHQRLIDEWKVSHSDVAKHMDWTTRAASPFISTSFSFAWCIWDASRRFHQGVKTDVQVAVIDARALLDRARTAVELLEASSSSERSKEYPKWHRFSHESQSVLVYGSIPGTAVLASIPLLAILRHLPSYFLQPDYRSIETENPLIRLGWDYKEKKSSYRRFCRNMSSQFFAMNTEERLADVTAGSLALGLAFLRPWFHSTIDKEDDLGVQTLVNLALIIARWPSQSWVQERPEIYDLISAMASTLSRELREKHELQVKDEVSRLQGVVNELHEVVRDYEVKFSSLGKRLKTSHYKRPVPRLVIDSPVLSPPTNTVSLPSTPTSPISDPKVLTPLTPPDTPKSSMFSTSQRPAPASSNWPTIGLDNEVGSLPTRGAEKALVSAPGTPTPFSAAAVTPINAIANQSFPLHNMDDASSSPPNVFSARLRSAATALTPPLLRSQSHAPSSGLSDIRPEEIPLPLTPPQHSPIRSGYASHRASSSFSSWTMVESDDDDDDDDGGDRDDDTQVDEDASYRKDLGDSITTLRDSVESRSGSPTLVFAPLPKVQEVPEYIPPRPRSGLFAEPLEFDYTLVDLDEEYIYRRPAGRFETAGCIIAGFLVGAFATMALLAPHRRMIVHLT